MVRRLDVAHEAPVLCLSNEIVAGLVDTVACMRACLSHAGTNHAAPTPPTPPAPPSAAERREARAARARAEAIASYRRRKAARHAMKDTWRASDAPWVIIDAWHPEDSGAPAPHPHPRNSHNNKSSDGFFGRQGQGAGGPAMAEGRSALYHSAESLSLIEDYIPLPGEEEDESVGLGAGGVVGGTENEAAMLDPCSGAAPESLVRVQV